MCHFAQQQRSKTPLTTTHFLRHHRGLSLAGLPGPSCLGRGYAWAASAASSCTQLHLVSSTVAPACPSHHSPAQQACFCSHDPLALDSTSLCTNIIYTSPIGAVGRRRGSRAACSHRSNRACDAADAAAAEQLTARRKAAAPQTSRVSAISRSAQDKSS